MMNLLIFFTLLFVVFVASHRALKRDERGSLYANVLPPPFDPLSKGYVFSVQAIPRTSDSNKGGYRLETWLARIFVAIVLQCAALFILSQLPGFKSPSWLGIVLQGFTYGSATLFYMSGRDDPTGY